MFSSSSHDACSSVLDAHRGPAFTLNFPFIASPVPHSPSISSHISLFSLFTVSCASVGAPIFCHAPCVSPACVMTIFSFPMVIFSPPRILWVTPVLLNVYAIFRMFSSAHFLIVWRVLAVVSSG